MGRSRGSFHSADEDPTQRSRRKKNASSGEPLESSNAVLGTSKGKKATYHCNYCNKDITGKIRIKCAVCSDFDLCIECFSVGAEVTPHKSNHPYRVMNKLSRDLICPDWNADDEMLLLEGMEMYGLGNWAEVAEHVGTKSKEQCLEHYRSIYLNSTCFPLPDMSHVVGENGKVPLSMEKGHVEDKKGFPTSGESNIQEESPFSPSRVKVEDSSKGGPPYSNSNPDPPVDQTKENKPTTSSNEAPSLLKMSGYNSKRQEFDPEYDQDAELLLADMEFKDADTEEERELKLRILRIYLKRLDERKRRKDFILKRNLLYPSPFEKDLSPEERAICRRYDIYMRFHSKEEHDEMLEAVIAEHRTTKRLNELREARSVGCRSSAEADRYLEHKRKREAEEGACRVRENSQEGPAGQNGSCSSIALDMMGVPRAELLSEAEKRLCVETKLVPTVYLRIQELISKAIFRGQVSNKSDAHRLFKIEPEKVDRVYDMLVKKGLAPA